MDNEKEETLRRISQMLRTEPETESTLTALSGLWDEASEAGRLSTLDELQDRFCVCMKWPSDDVDLGALVSAAV